LGGDLRLEPVESDHECCPRVEKAAEVVLGLGVDFDQASDTEIVGLSQGHNWDLGCLGLEELGNSALSLEILSQVFVCLAPRPQKGHWDITIRSAGDLDPGEADHFPCYSGGRQDFWTTGHLTGFDTYGVDEMNKIFCSLY